MALIEQTLDRGIVDKEQIAIARIREFESQALRMDAKHGYYVCDSGGKDSLVITHLAYMADVKMDIHHNHTTADHPETVRYVRRMARYWQERGIDYHIEKPTYKGAPTSMWKLIAEKGLPTRLRRWCCQILKEGGGAGRTIITGVRRAESVNRRSRGIAETITTKKADKLIVKNNDNDESRNIMEICPTYRSVMVNPIIDWRDEDVWEYIRKYALPYNPLYDKGYKRVGCVGCPMNTRLGAELADNPAYYRLYRNAMQRYMNTHKHLLDKYGWKDADDAMQWWFNAKRTCDCLDGQMSIFEEDE